MWRSTIGEFDTILEGCLEGLQDQILSAGIICSTVVGLFGSKTPPAAFIDPDFVNDGDLSPSQVHRLAMDEARAVAEDEHEQWLRRLGVALPERP